MSLHTAVQAFLDQESARGVDFSECLILTPHHHLGQAFRQALRQQRAGALLPPKITTWPELAETHPDARQPLPEGRVLATLHDILARLPQLLPHSALWPAAQELANLMADMEAAGLGDEALEGLLATPNPHLSAEAAIAQAVWRACRSELPRIQGLQAERLLALARQADRPLYALGLLGLSAREQAFLDLWSQRHPVITLPMPPEFPTRRAMLDAAWAENHASLRQRAMDFVQAYPTSPVAQDWKLLPARSLEAAAQGAADQVMQWLRQGRRQIALIALDRMLARRLRALLERSQVLIQDETGWALSTASASHVLDRWLALLGPAMPHGELLDLMKSPYIAIAAAPDLAVSQLERAFRRHGPGGDLEGHLALARELGLQDASEALGRIAQARAQFPQGRARLQAWTEALWASLGALGALEPLAADPIGAQLLELLQRLGRESAGHPTSYSLGDWRRWLTLHLEQSVFTDTSVESPIRLTHLAAAHHRSWDATLLLGVDAAHLPGRARAQIFNDATRRQLALPGISEREATQQVILADLLGRTNEVALVWQQEKAGEELALSPWLIQLDVFHQLAWGDGMTRQHPNPGWLQPGALTTPSTPTDEVRSPPPARLTVSAWQSLVACPYQFHARHLLGLNEPDEVTEELEKADYGSRVHALLAAFHGDHPALGDEETETLVAELTARTRAAFAADEARDYAAQAWRLRWERQIPAYIAWARDWEAQGYRNTAREALLSAEVVWDGGITRLEGRADRLDRHQDGVVVLDYKTQTRTVLRAKAKGQGEDVQLPAYAWLAGAAQAGFVALEEKGKVDVVAWDGDLAEAAAEEAQRLADTFNAMAAGVPLPAQGAPNICQWCEMRGLCRAEHQAT